MRLTLRATMMTGILAVGGILTATSPADAGCGGGSRGGSYGGHCFGRATYARGCGGSCNMAGVNMAAPTMQTMPMAGASMPGMNMGGYAAPAGVGAQYT